jgi:hypothetical protein
LNPAIPPLVHTVEPVIVGGSTGTRHGRDRLPQIEFEGRTAMRAPACDTENLDPGTAALAGDETSEIRVEKVLEVRRQLGEGTYCIAERLDVVVERILKDLL